MKSSLDNIKVSGWRLHFRLQSINQRPSPSQRKAPAPRKSTPQPGGAAAKRNAGNDAYNGVSPAELAGLQGQIDQLRNAQHQMGQHMQSMSQDYQSVMGEMMNFQRNMVAQDELTQNLIQYLINLEAGEFCHSTFISASADPLSPAQDRNPSADPATFQPSSQAQKLISSYHDAARATYDQMADLSRRASLSNGALPPIPLPPPGFGQFDVSSRMQMRPAPQQHGREDSQQGAPHGSAQRRPSGAYDGNGPRDNGPGGSGVPGGNGAGYHPEGPAPDDTSAQAPPPPSQPGSASQQQLPLFQHPSATNEGPGPAPGGPNSQRRQTYVPGWAVPPRVLLVEDDAVCRKLSSKFLEVFGCSIDVAVDGVSAVNKVSGDQLAKNGRGAS